MEAVLRQYVPPEGTYLELIFEKLVTPWYRGIGTRGAQVYTRVSAEIRLLKEKKEKKAQHKTQPKKTASARAEKDEVERLPDRLTSELAVQGKGQPGTAKRTKEDSEIQKYKQEIAFLQKEIKQLKLKGTNARNSPAGSPAVKVSDSRLTELQNQCDEKENLIKELYEQCAEQTDDIEHFKEQVRRLQESLQNAKDEIDNLTSRLSKIVGDKVRDGNPNIADLSDPNRPTEIGQKFSELYDNEWSDAFEEMNFKEDDRKVRSLLVIIEDAFSYCEKMHKSQIPAIRTILEGATTASPENGPVQEIKTNSNTSQNLHNMLKDVRKSFAGAAAENVSKSFITNEFLDLCTTIDVGKPGPHLTSFGRHCARISWLMLVCDPPMALETCKKGDAYEGNRYKAYTRSDRHMTKPVIEFAVWPALLLHDGGPLVARGVAQPIDGGQTGKKK